MGTLHEDQYIFLIIYRSVRRRLRNVSDKSCRGNQNSRLMFNIFFFRKSCQFWDNVGNYVRSRQVTDKHTIMCMRIAS